MKYITNIFVFLLFITPSIYAQEISVDDLMPPAHGGSTEIQSPEDVQIEGNVVTAATAQDAVNAVVQSEDMSSNGAYWTKFGSGWGVVSRGSANFREMPNPTAGLVAQRNAYVIAYTKAKAGLATLLAGATSEGTTEFKRFSELLAGSESNQQVSGDLTSEQIRQSANKVLKGYITYEWSEKKDEEDPTVHTVSVTLAVTPKSITASQRTGLVNRVDKLQDGLQALLTEITSGVVPPVGGRVVTVSDTGQTAVVGFGSAIVTKSSDRQQALDNQLDARTAAETGAIDALVGILTGDQTMWTTGLVSNIGQEFAESTKFVLDDSGNSTATESIKRSFLANRKLEKAITSARKGALPPGTSTKHSISEDGNWANCIIIYYPDMTAVAQDFSQKMDEADLLSGARDPGKSGSGNDSLGSSDKNAKGGKRVETRVKPLPGGKLNKDDQ